MNILENEEESKMLKQKFGNQEIKSLLIRNFCVTKELPQRNKERDLGFWEKIIIFLVVSLFGVVYIYVFFDQGSWLMLIGSWPALAGVYGIIHTIIDNQKQEKRYQKEMEEYQSYLVEFEQNRKTYMELVNEGKYYVEEEKVTSKREWSAFHDSPVQYLINNHFQVAAGMYAKIDYGDVIRMYGVEGFGIHLMILQKRNDFSEFELKTVRD